MYGAWYLLDVMFMTLFLFMTNQVKLQDIMEDEEDDDLQSVDNDHDHDNNQTGQFSLRTYLYASSSSQLQLNSFCNLYYCISNYFD